MGEKNLQLSADRDALSAKLDEAHNLYEQLSERVRWQPLLRTLVGRHGRVKDFLRLVLKGHTP